MNKFNKPPYRKAFKTFDPETDEYQGVTVAEMLVTYPGLEPEVSGLDKYWAPYEWEPSKPRIPARFEYGVWMGGDHGWIPLCELADLTKYEEIEGDGDAVFVLIEMVSSGQIKPAQVQRVLELMKL